jgi:hypothetical protein
VQNVSASREWQGDEYLIWVQEKVSEASALAPRVTLNRKISTKLGASSLTIEDTIENEGHAPCPFMMLYHFNFSFPVLSGDTVLLSPTKDVVTVAVARLCGKERNFTGKHLCAHGYAVSTVGFKLEQVHQCIHE